MDIAIILIFVMVFLISAIVLTKPRGLPPGPLSFPVVGCISILRQFSCKRPHIVLYEAAKKYGNIMSFKMGREKIVVLSGYDTIHEALVKQSDVFSDRPFHLPEVWRLIKDGGGNYSQLSISQSRISSQTTDISK